MLTEQQPVKRADKIVTTTPKIDRHAVGAWDVQQSPIPEQQDDHQNQAGARRHEQEQERTGAVDDPYTLQDAKRTDEPVEIRKPAQIVEYESNQDQQQAALQDAARGP